MSYDRDHTLAVEYQRILNQAPWLKPVYGDLSRYQGTIRIQGVDIQIEIVLPDFYPVVKPIVYVNNVNHYLIRPDDRTVQTSILDHWTPEKTVIDVIQSLKRDLSKGKIIPLSQTQATSNLKPQSRISYQVTPQVTHSAPSTSMRVVNESEITRVQNEITRLQEELREIQSRIVREQERQLTAQGTMNASIHVSLVDELRAKEIAVSELLEILDEKFDDGDLGDVEFFRLYKIYMKEKYVIETQLQNVSMVGEKKHGVSRTHEKREQVRS